MLESNRRHGWGHVFERFGPILPETAAARAGPPGKQGLDEVAHRSPQTEILPIEMTMALLGCYGVQHICHRLIQRHRLALREGRSEGRLAQCSACAICIALVFSVCERE